MTGPELYLEALRLRQQANEWMDADTGWKANLSSEARIAYRVVDLAEAQLCATLALAAATALGSPLYAAENYGPDPDLTAWVDTAGTPTGGAL